MALYNPETRFYFSVNKRESTESLATDEGDMMLAGSATLPTSNDTSTIGIAFGAMIVGLLIITLVVIVLLCMFLCKLKRKYTTLRRCSQLQQPIAAVSKYSNPVYSTNEKDVETDCSKDTQSALVDPHHNSHKQLQACESAPHDYALLESHDDVKPKTLPQAAESDMEYSYATTENRSIRNKSKQKEVFVHHMDSYSNSYASSGPGANQRLNSRKTATMSSYYMSPASDETSLYIQFSEIDINSLSRESVVVQGFLGSGQFGTVHKGVWQSGDHEVEVAVKTLKEGSSEIDKIKFLQEAAIMGQFSHPNVVKLYGVVTKGNPVMIVLELLSMGDLKKHLREARERLANGQPTDITVDEHTLLSYCRQVASGMSYLANKAFVHRDLAARNILVAEYGMCKIADFGMSRDLEDETYYISHGGKIPVKWTAPEALNYQKYSTASDVWSYGCLMFEIWSLGQKPFEGYSNNEAIRLVDEGLRLPPPTGCPRAIYKIMISCWHPLTSERPSFNDLMQKLSMSDTRLLKWSDEDKAVHPEASKIGAELEHAFDLFRDIQSVYVKHTDTHA